MRPAPMTPASNEVLLDTSSHISERAIKFDLNLATEVEVEDFDSTPTPPHALLVTNVRETLGEELGHDRGASLFPSVKITLDLNYTPPEIELPSKPAATLTSLQGFTHHCESHAPPEAISRNCVSLRSSTRSTLPRQPERRAEKPDSQKPPVKRKRNASKRDGPKPVSGIKGVSFYQSTGKWETYIWYDRKQEFIGSYATALEGAMAYDRAAKGLGLRRRTLEDITSNNEPLPILNNITVKEFLNKVAKVGKSSTRMSTRYRGVYVDPIGMLEVIYDFKRKSRKEKKRFCFLGYFKSTELEMAAREYDKMALDLEGANAVLNFPAIT